MATEPSIDRTADSDNGTELNNSSDIDTRTDNDTRAEVALGANVDDLPANLVDSPAEVHPPVDVSTELLENSSENDRLLGRTSASSISAEVTDHEENVIRDEAGFSEEESLTGPVTGSDTSFQVESSINSEQSRRSHPDPFSHTTERISPDWWTPVWLTRWVLASFSVSAVMLFIIVLVLYLYSRAHSGLG